MIAHFPYRHRSVELADRQAEIASPASKAGRELALIGAAKRRSVEERQRANIRRVTAEMRERHDLPPYSYPEDH